MIWHYYGDGRDSKRSVYRRMLLPGKGERSTGCQWLAKWRGVLCVLLCVVVGGRLQCSAQHTKWARPCTRAATTVCKTYTLMGASHVTRPSPVMGRRVHARIGRRSACGCMHTCTNAQACSPAAASIVLPSQAACMSDAPNASIARMSK